MSFCRETETLFTEGDNAILIDCISLTSETHHLEEMVDIIQKDIVIRRS